MYQYTPREEMQSILDLADFPENGRAEIAYQRFVYDGQGVIYIEENEILLGVVSIGDLERYYASGNNRLEINQHFSFAGQIEEEKATAFFERVRTFFEFPVVNAHGRLEGVMKRDVRYDIRQDQIASLVISKYLKKQWHKRELDRFLTDTRARVVLYYADVTGVLREIVSNRRLDSREKKEETFWKDLSKSQWDRFLGEADAVMSLKKEFGNFHTEMRKGVSEIVDMEGEFFHCKEGSRITWDNPKNPEGRIIFYGPCIVVGAYCRDEQTIASCLQRMLNLQTDLSLQVVNRGLFNVVNFFSRMMTDELSEKDIVVIFVEKGWLTEDISSKCVYVGDLTSTYLSVENLENNILDNSDHCNYKVNERLAERIFCDLEEHKLFEGKDLTDEKTQIQNYYIGSEIMSEVLLYMERNNLQKEMDSGIKGAMALLADPFTDRHKRAVEAALQEVDILYLFLSEDSNLKHTLEERMQIAKEVLEDWGNRVVVAPAGKYLYTKKISRGIRKQRFCDDDMEFDCDIFGEVFGGIMGISYRFVMSELDNPVERKYLDTCMDVLPRFGIKVEEILF